MRDFRCRSAGPIGLVVARKNLRFASPLSGGGVGLDGIHRRKRKAVATRRALAPPMTATKAMPPPLLLALMPNAPGARGGGEGLAGGGEGGTSMNISGGVSSSTVT